MREGASAILLDTDGRLLLQLRDNLPHIRDPGKISLFGGSREGNESFLDCIVREVHEEIGCYLPPARFAQIGRWAGPDYAFPGDTFHGEIFLANEVPVDQLTIAEGALRIVAVDELELVRPHLSLAAQYALGIFLSREQTIRSLPAPAEGQLRPTTRQAVDDTVGQAINRQVTFDGQPVVICSSDQPKS